MVKVFVLGLDGVTFDILKPFIEQGHLPNFKKILDEGSTGVLKSVIPNSSIPAWPCFYTGQNPGKLGVYYHVRDIIGSYKKELVKVNSKNDLWSEVSKNGKTVGIFNIPGTYPPVPVNGFFISGFFTPPGAKHTYPAELSKLIGGDYKEFMDGEESIYVPEKKRLKFIKSKINECSHFMNLLYDKYVPDLFIGVYEMTDVLQHFLWKFYDPTHEEYKKSPLNSAFLDCYKILDKQVGEILKKIGEDSVLIIMSDHGFEKVEKNAFLNQGLLQKGLLKINKQREIIGMNKNFHKLRDLLVKIAIRVNIRKIIPQKIKEKVKISIKDVDWDKSTCFAGFFGAIFVNTKKKDYDSTSYDLICKEIKEVLSELKDPKTSKLLLSKVYLKKEIFSGDKMDLMPDLVAVPSKGYVLRGDIKSVLTENSELSGIHNMDGIFMAFGSGIKKNKFKVASLLDVTPTILHMLNLKIPNNVDGKVMDYIFEENSEFNLRKINFYDVEQEKNLRDAINNIDLPF